MPKENKEIKLHSIEFNFLMNVILKVSQFIFPLITFPYVSRVLGVEANGKIDFASSVVSYFSLVASLGIPSYGVRKCAEVRNDKVKLSKIVKELLIINTSCLVVTYLVFVICVFSVDKFAEESILFFVTSTSIVFNVLGVEWLYQAIEQYSYITVRNIVFKIIGLVLLFLMVHSSADYIVYAGIVVFASVGSNILNILRLNKYVDLKTADVDKRNLFVHINPILILFLYNATTTVYTSLDRTLLGFIKSNTSVGYYSAAIKIKNIIVSFITALGAVLVPRVSYYLSNNKENEFVNLIKKSFDFILISSIPLALFFIIKSQSIVVFAGGDKYLPSADVLKCLIPSIIFIGLSSVTSWQLLIPLGKEKVTVYGAILGAITDVVLNIFLIPKYDAVGAAISSSIAELVVLITHFVFLKSTIKKTFETKELLKSLLASIISSLLLLFIDRFMIYSNLFIDCMVSAIVFFVTFAILLLLIKEKIVTEYSAMFVQKVKGL